MKDPKRLTIADIARLSGVSPTAVSFVMNGREGVSEATRVKVNSFIEATGFRPNASSRRLSCKKSFNIAILYPPSASPFTDLYYFEVARGLTEKLSQEGFNVVVTSLDNSRDGITLPRILLHRDADGVVVLQDVDPSVLSGIDGLGIPYVLVDIHVQDRIHTHVSVDSEISIHTAMNYLIAHGHERIAFLGSDWLSSYYMQCVTGYRKALDERNLPIQPAWLQKDAFDTQHTEACMDAILSCPDRPSAVCCMGDMLAIDAMDLVKRRGLSIPEDLSFISIDDIILSRYVDPPLTTIVYDKLAMGRTAAELLLSKIAGNPVDSAILESGAIVERKTVKTIAAAIYRAKK
jgi:LacI family transcriptional regulator